MEERMATRGPGHLLRALCSAGIAAWALSLGPGCEGDGPGPAPTSACGSSVLFWDDGVGTLHPAEEPLEPGNLYRCVSPDFRPSCGGPRVPMRQDVIGELHPVVPAPGGLYRCAGPAFSG